MATVTRSEGGIMKVQAKKVQVTDEIRQAVLAQLDNAVYYGGEQCFHFERELAAYVKAEHALALNSGTSALLVAAMAVGVRAGDEVLVPANVYDTSAEIPAFLGAVPIFCDVEADTANVTAETLAARLSPRTKAIILTHMYGHPADMDPIMEMARTHRLPVIEVCAHALGAEYKGRRVGTGRWNSYPDMGGQGCRSTSRSFGWYRLRIRLWPGCFRSNVIRFAPA